MNFFYENINQEHNLLPDCAFELFTYAYCENCMSGFSAFVLNLRKSGNILFRSMPNGNCSAQHHCHCHCQSVIGGNLFSSTMAVFELAQGLQDSKTSDLNCFYEALVQKVSLTICQDRVFASFLCALSLSSVLGRFIHLYCDTGSLRRSTPASGGGGSKAPPLLPHSQYICCKYIIEDRGKIHSLIVFYKLFLSDIEIKILINSWHFLTFFLDVPSAAL